MPLGNSPNGQKKSQDSPGSLQCLLNQDQDPGFPQESVKGWWYGVLTFLHEHTESVTTESNLGRVFCGRNCYSICLQLFPTLLQTEFLQLLLICLVSQSARGLGMGLRSTEPAQDKGLLGHILSFRDVFC